MKLFGGGFATSLELKPRARHRQNGHFAFTESRFLQNRRCQDKTAKSGLRKPKKGARIPDPKPSLAPGPVTPAGTTECAGSGGEGFREVTLSDRVWQMSPLEFNTPAF